MWFRGLRTQGNKERYSKKHAGKYLQCDTKLDPNTYEAYRRSAQSMDITETWQGIVLVYESVLIQELSEEAFSHTFAIS